MRLRELQQQQNEWSRRNFGKQPAYRSLLGAVEELGELCHAHLKGEQGIRGSQEKHLLDAEDAVADTVIFLASYCNSMGFDLESIVERTWNTVKTRDWRTDTVTAGTGIIAVQDEYKQEDATK